MDKNVCIPPSLFFFLNTFHVIIKIKKNCKIIMIINAIRILPIGDFTTCCLTASQFK